MKYKHDVTITHDVRLLDMEKLSLNVPKNIGVNQIASPSACFAQILNMFQSNDEDVSLDISKAKTVARNYENCKNI